MRPTRNSSIIVFLLATTVFTSCRGTSSGTAAAPGPASTNANAPAPQPAPTQPDAAASPSPAAPAQLVGTYVMSEVQDGGVSTIISEMRTAINFSDDGTYRRGASKKNRLYHTDSGRFRIDGDKLVLTIQVSKLGAESKLHSPPLQKVHKFTLSANGDELRLISGDGKVALFRRSDTIQK